MKISINEIKRLLLSILKKGGLSDDDAEILAMDYLEGELQGKYSHGLQAFPALAKKLPIELEEPEVLNESEAAIFVDAKGGLGAVVGYKYADKAIEKARKQGVAMVFIKNMKSWLRPSSVARYIAEQNMIGYVVNNGGNAMMAPPGGYEPRVGTNPIGIGIPADGHDIVVDMATSKRAWGEVRKAKFDDTELPENTYFNKEGGFTRNPDEAVSVVGAETYKGFALGLYTEIIAGALIGMPMNQQMDINVEYRTMLRGAMIYVIDPAFTTSVETFKKENAELADQIRSTKTVPGVDKVFLPGDRAAEYKKKALAAGELEVSEELWGLLNSFS